MITEKQYNEVKHYSAQELKLWLEQNNFYFSDLRKAANLVSRKEDIDKIIGRFCICCGAPQNDKEQHTEECIWYESNNN